MGTLSVPGRSVPSPSTQGTEDQGLRTRDQGTRDRAISEQVSDLKLHHPRRIDIRERRERIGRRAGADELTERRIRRTGIAVRRLRAPEDVAMIKEVEALQPQQDRAAPALDTFLDKDRDILRARAAERGLADDDAVD